MMSTHHILAHLAPATIAQATAPAAAPAGNPMPEGTIPPDFWMPVGASTIAGSVDQMLAVINWICYFFFALVVVLMVYFAWKYRVRSNSHRFRMDGPVHNTPLELTWTIIPLLLCVVIFFMGFRGYLDFSQPPKNSYDIDVTAVKWAWTFKYPNGAQSDDLYVPAGRPVRLVMRSNDVLHSLYIPAFRVKRDVVPGRYSHLWFQSDAMTGMDHGYHLFCTEYCGTGHSNMNRRVYVLGETEFNEWLEQQARWIDEIDDEELYFKAGPKIYARCSQCHSIDGSVGTGPSWKGLWEKVSGGAGSDQKFADGKSYRDLIGPGKEYATPEDYIRDSIYNPGKHLVTGYGNVMPTFKGQLSDRATDAVIGMLKRLDEFDSKGQWTKAPAPAAK